MRRDCAVCRSEGFTTQARVQLTARSGSIVATLSVVDGPWLGHGIAGLSEAAWTSLRPQPGEWLTVSHAPVLESLSHVRAKVYGHRLDAGAFRAVIGDIAAGRYSDLHLATFITACAGDRLDLDETVALTRAMIDVGNGWTGAATGSWTNIASAACRATARRCSSCPSSRPVA
jgi:thymidine phosphorylase